MIIEYASSGIYPSNLSEKYVANKLKEIKYGRKECNIFKNMLSKICRKLTENNFGGLLWKTKPIFLF